MIAEKRWGINGILQGCIKEIMERKTGRTGGWVENRIKYFERCGVDARSERGSPGKKDKSKQYAERDKEKQEIERRKKIEESKYWPLYKY